MSYEDHLKSCSYCNGNKDPQKPSIKIKGASSYRRDKNLAEPMSVIKGVSYPGISYVGEKKTNTTKSKGASSIEKSQKLMELGRLIRGYCTEI